MVETLKLEKAVDYSDSRININDVLLEDFVTTDNLLPNKQGLSEAVNLPPQEGYMSSFQKDNILVANIRPYLRKIWFANRSGGCSADVLVFDVKKEHDPKFVYYAMFRDDFFDHMMRGSKGTKMPRGDKTHILDFTIPKFNPTNQKKIAAVLSALDAKIESNNRINTQLEAMAKMLYDYWFVQFDFPDKNGKPYKSSGGKMVYNKELKRKIPEGWEVKELGQVLKTCLGGTPSTKNESYWKGGTIPWLNSGEIANFPITCSEAFITQDAIDNSATELMPKGSVLISITRYIRPSILAIDACANQSVVGIYESENILSSLIYPYMLRETPRYMSIRTGAQQPHINKDSIDMSLMAIPTKAVLDNYYKLSNPLYEKIVNNAFQNQQLTELRDWLLPMLMNDQVSVK